MIELIGDIFQQRDADAICFTSNGIVKSDGTLTMGAGIAKSFRDRYKGLSDLAGKWVKTSGNCVGVLTNTKPHILNFPTKKHWKEPSSLMLIRKSAKELLEITNKRGWKKVYLSRPGCGLGQLDWEKQVKPLVKDLFDDRFVVCHWVEAVRV